MFRDVINRRRLLLTLSGVGGAALLIGLLGNRDSAETPTDNGTSTDNWPSEVTPEPSPVHFETTYAEVTCAENQLAFDPSELVAPANGQISLTFHNISAYFEHNWVLVNGNDSVVNQIVETAAEAGPEASYVPEGRDDIIAHTQLVKAGESATITFGTPPAGEYTYICTFPGHCLAGMRGVLKVTAA